MYKVTFKGDRLPETLDDEKGAKLYEMKKDGDMPTNVELRKGMLIMSTSIRDVEYVADEQRKDYSEPELLKFEKEELKEFLNEKGELASVGELLFYQSKGLVNYTGPKDAPYVASFDIQINRLRTRDFADMQHKMSQYKFLKGRKYYAQKHEAREHDLKRSREAAPLKSPEVPRLCLCGCGEDLNVASKKIGYFLSSTATGTCTAKLRRIQEETRLAAT